MDVQTIKIERHKAWELYRAYKRDRHYSTPIDDEVARAYKLIGEGRTIIKALESITAAGLNAQGLPKLAIASAVATACACEVQIDGSAVMDCRKMQSWKRHDSRKWVNQRCFIGFPRNSFQRQARHNAGRTLVPGIPLHLKPKRGLENYHVLWEAEWTPIPSRDPYLLRRIGKADLWLVVAAWDLTEVERAALATRINL